MVGGDRLATGLKGEGIGGGVLQIPIGIVFDNDDIVLMAESVDLFAAGKREQARGWILAHAAGWSVQAVNATVGDLRYGVHQVRSLALVFVPFLEDICQSSFAFSQHTFIIDLDRNDRQTTRFGSLDGVHVCKFFAQDSLSVSDPIPIFVPNVAECLDRLGETISGTDSQDDLGTTLVWNIWM